VTGAKTYNMSPPGSHKEGGGILSETKQEDRGKRWESFGKTPSGGVRKGKENAKCN